MSTNLIRPEFRTAHNSQKTISPTAVSGRFRHRPRSRFCFLPEVGKKVAVHCLSLLPGRVYRSGSDTVTGNAYQNYDVLLDDIQIAVTT
ncbi:hypothetical protein MTP99_005730 [Tenebrio molitor]|nr:hypothetical protein MTP99_005730 [Tenebrio molitor]